jgi:hypothetical protein
MPNYNWDLFLSYSHLDDLSPSEAPGWVTQFKRSLDVFLTKRLGRPSRIWFDHTLNGQNVFDLTIQKAIDDSAILMALYSASYADSAYCAKEREWFAKSGLTVGDQKRIFPVHLVKVPHERWPREFDGCTGFEFFRVSANDPVGFPLDPTDSLFSQELRNVVVALDSVLAALSKVREAVVEAAPVAPVSRISAAAQDLEPVRPENPPAPPPQLPAAGAASPGSEETFEFEMLKRTFKDDFQQCVGQIQLLSARKELHDQLHELQFKFFIPVSDLLAGSSLTADNQLLSIVREHSFTLSEICDTLRVIASRTPPGSDRPLLPRNELSWIEDVAKARNLIEVGMRDFDLVPLRTAVQAVRRVLAVWPSRINAKLNENARELALADLAGTLQELCTKSSTFAQRLGDKIAKLRELHVQISELAALHDDWQTFDDEMRLLEATLNQSMKDIADTWPGLKEKAKTLYAENSETWAKRLAFFEGEMDRAVQAQDLASAQRCFIRLRSAARDRFYLADQNLKNGCQDLERVGGPIGTILEVV